MQIARIAAILLFACASLMISGKALLADQRPWSKEELETMATHVAVGKVKAIYSFKERKGDYEYTRFVAEVKIDKHEKGKGAKDLVYMRYFTINWKGSGPTPPGMNGHADFLPKTGKTYRFYLSRKGYDGASLEGPKDGGFNIICPNGVQTADNPHEEKTQPNSDSSLTKTGGKFRVQSRRETGKWQYGSVIEVRSDADNQLLHSFRVPGNAKTFLLTPDEKTLYTAEVTGNLGWMATIRAFDLATGNQSVIDECIGGVGQLTLSPDGTRLAANMDLGPFEFQAVAKQMGAVCIGLIYVWKLDDPKQPMVFKFSPPDDQSQDFMYVMGVPSERKEILAETSQRIVPVKFRFSRDSRLLVSETRQGFIVVHDLESGKPQTHASTSSVNMLTAMKIVSLSAIPPDVNRFSIEWDDSGALLAKRQEDGWWQLDRNGKKDARLFKVEKDNYFIKEGGIERAEALLPLLGLNAGTDLSALESIKHPLGLIEIETEMSGINFKLTTLANKAGETETIRQGAVEWNGQDQTENAVKDSDE